MYKAFNYILQIKVHSNSTDNPRSFTFILVINIPISRARAAFTLDIDQILFCRRRTPWLRISTRRRTIDDNEERALGSMGNLRVDEKILTHGYGYDYEFLDRINLIDKMNDHGM